MRNKNVLHILSACVVGFLTFSGCLDITTTSKVNSNGSIVRTITFTGDSAEVHEGNFPIELDATGSKTITRSEGKDKNYTLATSRTFRNVEEMNKVLGGTFGRTLQYKFELEKSYQWFFTVYRYKETTLPYAQFTSLPMTDFLSQEEIGWIKDNLLDVDSQNQMHTRGDSLAFESIVPRAQEYDWRNHFEPVYASFLEGVKSINSPSLTVAMITPLKDSLYNRSKKSLDQKKIDTLQFIWARVLRSPLVEKAWQASARGINEIKRKIDFESKTNSHKYITSVIMPGLITGSNATRIEGATATWQEFKEHAHYLGFTMWVESRQVNWWVVVIALVIVVSLMAGLVLSALRRRRQI